MPPRERNSESVPASSNSSSSPLSTATTQKGANVLSKYIPSDVPICTTPSVGQEYEGLLGNGLKTKKLLDVSIKQDNKQTHI